MATGNGGRQLCSAWRKLPYKASLQLIVSYYTLVHFKSGKPKTNYDLMI